MKGSEAGRIFDSMATVVSRRPAISPAEIVQLFWFALGEGAPLRPPARTWRRTAVLDARLIRAVRDGAVCAYCSAALSLVAGSDDSAT